MEPNAISRGSWCPRCRNHCPIQAREKFEALVKSKEDIITGQYINTFVKVSIQCINSHYFNISPSNASQGK